MPDFRPRVLFFMATGSPVGGVATWLDRACSELGERGFDPTVALVRGMRTHDAVTYKKYHPSLPSTEVDGRGLNREGRIRACERMIQRQRPSLVLPLGVLDAADAAFRMRLNRRPIRVVGRAQGNLPPMLADLEDRREGFDHVVCVGEMTRRYLIKHASFPENRVCHIANGATDPTHRRVEAGDNRPLRLGFVGRLTSGDKRVLDIPPFCQSLDDLGVPFELSIVGAGPSGDQLRERLVCFGDRVRFTGPLSSQDVYSAILPNLDVLLLFSASETFGIVLAEAMMNGVVPVTSRYIGSQTQQLVVEERHGLAFDVADSVGAARCVQRLHRDRGLLRQLSRAGQSHAAANLSWKNCFDRWSDALHQVLERPAVGGCPNVSLAITAGKSRLDRLRVPQSLRDGLRRLRRTAFGPGIAPGGEEWPLFSRHHNPERLAQIKDQCLQLESEARLAAGSGTGLIGF